MGVPTVSIRAPEAYDLAISHLQAGHLIVLPTDTIYGIAAQSDQDGIIARLYAVRQRPPEPALPFLISQASIMTQLTRTNVPALRLAQRFWPGPLSLILPPAANLPPAFRAYPIAVRVPNFAPLLGLLDRAGGYLLTTGAIRPGHPPAISAEEVATIFGDAVSLILDGGPAPYGVPSTIVDCVPDPPVIVRRGVISEERIWETLGNGTNGVENA